MVEIVNGIALEEVVIPLVCFAACIIYQYMEFVRSGSDHTNTRALFKSVRAGWVKDAHMQGGAAVNTTRDYIKTALFMATSAITLAVFIVGYSGSVYTDCKDVGDCTAKDWVFVVKLAALAAALFAIFFVWTQCTRFMVHFSLCINVREIRGVPVSEALMVKILEHSHRYFSLGLRLYFGTIPVFAWIFTPWALLVVTPVYLYMVRGLEGADFVRAEIEEVGGRRALCTPPPPPPPSRGSSTKATEVALEAEVDKRL